MTTAETEKAESPQQIDALKLRSLVERWKLQSDAYSPLGIGRALLIRCARELEEVLNQ